MGIIFLAAWLLPAIAFVIGGLLIRGQAAIRGVRWWAGWLLLIGGGLALIYVQVVMII